MANFQVRFRKLTFVTIACGLTSPARGAVVAIEQGPLREHVCGTADDCTFSRLQVTDFYVTTDSDIVSIDRVTVMLDAVLNQNPVASDTERPHPALEIAIPALSFDTFITTPGVTRLHDPAGFSAPLNGWLDDTNDGPVNRFLFARIGAREVGTGTFSGRIVTAGPDGPVPFEFLFHIPAIPEPSAATLGVLAAAIGRRLHRRRPGEA